MESGLYVVATPIGNLQDITLRAIEVLRSADLIAAEDTRHTRRLLDAIDAESPMISLHEHNESSRVELIAEKLESGAVVALVSDAGTPLISDPGSTLVASLRAKGLRVTPVPGPSAVISALCAAGLASDKFIFEGFLPAKTNARRTELERFLLESRTVVFYESPHRIQSTLEIIKELMPERRLVLAREVTKTFETFLDGTAADLLSIMAGDANQLKGEFVVLLNGAPTSNQDEALDDARRLLQILVKTMPVKAATSAVAEYLGLKKNRLYDLALELKRIES